MSAARRPDRDKMKRCMVAIVDSKEVVPVIAIFQFFTKDNIALTDAPPYSPITIKVVEEGLASYNIEILKAWRT